MPHDFKGTAQAALGKALVLVPMWLPRGQRRGKYWVALNPMRRDTRAGSFSVNLQTGQWGDFAIGQTGNDLISLKAYLHNLPQGDACTALAAEVGCAGKAPACQWSERACGRTLAAHIWSRSQPIGLHNLVTTYLRKRGLALASLPHGLRYHPSLQDGITGRTYPVMVAKVSDVHGNLCGVHRTFLDATGSKANMLDPKKSLGNVAGGAVRLCEAGDTLAVAEGIETALAYHELTGTPTWAALSTSGLRRLLLPPTIHKVHLAVDDDVNGAGEAAALVLANRLMEEGRHVTLMHPRPRMGQTYPTSQNVDWLDVLNAEMGHE